MNMSINWQEIVFNFWEAWGSFSIVLKPWEKACNRLQEIDFDTILINIRVIPFWGVLVGIGMTALIQSSSGVTVITVGLVSAGLLTLRQAIGIVIGANIGTTITSFIIGFKLETTLFPCSLSERFVLLYQKSFG